MSDPSQDEGVVELVALLQEVLEAMARLSGVLADAVREHPTDLTALSVLARHRGRRMTIGALGDELGLTKASATALVDRLERAGHVSRFRDESDRRRIYLELDESALEVADTVLRAFLLRLRGVLRTYDDGRLEQARRFLGDVRMAIDAEAEPPG